MLAFRGFSRQRGTSPVSRSPPGESDSNVRDSRPVLRGPGRGFPFGRGSEMWGIYSGIAFAGLLALIFGRASRRHP